MTEPQAGIDRRTLLVGAVLLTAGTLLGLARLELFELASLRGWWPLAVVAFGLGWTATGADRKTQRSGVWFALVGAWLLVNTLELFGFHWTDSWPLLPIGGGLLDLLWPTPEDDRYDGFVWMAVGVWLLLNTRDYLDFTWSDSWPLLLVFVGVAILLKAVVQAIPVLTGGRQQ
jgi:hypothetical protein